jgi:POT family proton-dependent oligopeptide transporter
MSATSQAFPDADRSGWAGHPRGLSTLFFIEMWERFSYYGMRAFLLYYMVASTAEGGLGFSDADGASIYGTYTGSVWAAAIFGGLVADRLLGQYRSVLAGGVLIALGHLTLVFRSLPFFYSGLALVVIGTGLLKPNVSIIVGSLYAEGDTRRDAGFSIFYMGINLGAFLGPIVAGWLAQRVDWHAGFAAAGVGMALGLVQYILGRSRLQPGLDRLAVRPRAAAALSEPAPAAFSPAEWRRMVAVVVFFLFATLFWGAYEQAGSTLALFADRYTRLSVLGYPFPSSWFQSVQPIFVILLAPVFAWLWMRLGPREPSSPAKFALGLLFVGIAFLVLMPAASLAQGGGFKVSPWWLVASYFVQELGELCLSPVGLSVVTKLSPARLVGIMMGVWFLSNAFGNKLAGSAAGFFGSMPLVTLFGIVAAVTLAAALLLFLLIPWVRRLMGDVR